MFDKFYEIEINLDIGLSGSMGPLITFNSSCYEKNNKIVRMMEVLKAQQPLDIKWEDIKSQLYTFGFSRNNINLRIKHIPNFNEKEKIEIIQITPSYTILEDESNPGEVLIFKSRDYMYFYEMFI